MIINLVIKILIIFIFISSIKIPKLINTIIRKLLIYISDKNFTLN